VRFAAVILCVASQRVFIVVYFVIDSVRKVLDTRPFNTEVVMEPIGIKISEVIMKFQENGP
jgi:uncharacterized membrane protein